MPPPPAGTARLPALLRPKTLFLQPELHVQNFTAGLRLKTLPEPGVCKVTTASAGVRVVSGHNECPRVLLAQAAAPALPELLPAIVKPETVRVMEVCDKSDG